MLDVGRHLEDLVQREYLGEFVLDQEEDPESEILQLSLPTKALTHQHNSGWEAPREAMELFSLEMILCKIM